MYPFGSGMPQQHTMSDPSQNVNSTTGMPPAIQPFGAGWIAPQNPLQQQQYHQQYNSPNLYPPLNPPYPSVNLPYPNRNMNSYHGQNYSHNVPFMPMNPTSMQNPPAHYQNQVPLPINTSISNNYSPQQVFRPSTQSSTGFQSPAGNMAQCFNEMAQTQNLKMATPSFSRKEGTPTVLPAHNYDPIKDAHDLRKAMKGFGTDENTLINIICRRTNEQRQEIQRQYKTNFGKDLIDDIKSETSGNFERLLVGLLRPIVDFYCAELNDAMSGIGTDEDVLIEILCTLSNLEIHTIKNQYLRLYGAHLESELKSETSGNFKRLLVSLCTAARDESGHVDSVAAQNDARELLKAGELRVGTDESMFNMVLCQRNYQQLKLIFQEYERMTGHSLEKAIKKEFSGDIMEGLIAIYRCVTNKAEYFASRLHKSMAGIGTNDKQLIRVIITRCEIDMGDIKASFERLYGKSLKSWIKGDTSGHYKHALYALVGEQRSS